MRVSAFMLVAGLAASLAACSGERSLRQADKLALYNAHAGAPVKHFRYFGSIMSWTPLGDSSLAVWTRPKQAYLLDLSGPCPDMPHAPAIGVSSQFGQVSARFDRVVVYNNNAFNIPCRIDKIRPLDVVALKAAERDKRAQVQASGT